MRDSRTRFTASLALILALLAGTLAAGCGESAARNAGPPQHSGEKVVLGHTGWDESIAFAALSKVLLQDELGYKEVELREFGPGEIFGAVAEGEVDAFPGVWMPRHEARIAGVEDRTNLLGSFLVGTTRSSLATPAYMNVRNLEDLRKTEAEILIGPSTGAAAVVADVPSGKLEKYGIEAQLDEPSTGAMIERMVRLMQDEKPFVFVAWSPHWINQKYDFDYIEDPEHSLSNLTQPSTLHVLTNKGLAGREPVAQALLATLRFNDYQLSSLELQIHQSGDPVKGARTWARDNEELTDRWVENVKNRVGRR